MSRIFTVLTFWALGQAPKKYRNVHDTQLFHLFDCPTVCSHKLTGLRIQAMAMGFYNLRWLSRISQVIMLYGTLPWAMPASEYIALRGGTERSRQLSFILYSFSVSLRSIPYYNPSVQSRWFLVSLFYHLYLVSNGLVLFPSQIWRRDSLLWWYQRSASA